MLGRKQVSARRMLGQLSTDRGPLAVEEGLAAGPLRFLPGHRVWSAPAGKRTKGASPTQSSTAPAADSGTSGNEERQCKVSMIINPTDVCSGESTQKMLAHLDSNGNDLGCCCWS